MPEHVSKPITTPELEQGHVSMAIADGHVAVVVWSGFYHPNELDAKVWYSEAELDTPATTPEAILTRTPAATRAAADQANASATVAVPTTAATSQSLSLARRSQPSRGLSSSMTIVASVAPALILVAGVVIAHSLSTRRKR
jgi:hypothetical protein